MDITYINNFIISTKKQIEENKQIANRYSIIRLCLLVAVVVTIYYGTSASSLFYILMLIGIILFFWFVSLHMRIKKEIELLEMKLETYEDMVKRKHDDWVNFKDEGNEFLKKDSTQAVDLDIFGKASLFQYLNVSKSIAGRECLANLLNCHQQDMFVISKRQEAIMELSSKEDFNTTLTSLLKLFEKHGRKKKKASFETFYEYMESDTSKTPFVFYILAKVLPIITWILLLYVVIFQGNYAYLMISFTVSIALSLLCVLKNAHAFSDVNMLATTMIDYERMFILLHETSFEAELLQGLKSRMEDTPKAIRKLRFIMSGIQMRNDGIMFMVMNALFMLDFQCVFALEKWKRQYGKSIRNWMLALGEVEAYVSLSQLNYAKDTLCMPNSLRCDKNQFHAKMLYHPLIQESHAIANDFEAEFASYVVTGSNMSGKTTFLRTIGLNMVLFHAGASVCAKEFCARSMNIFTSMRIKDDVSEGVSTFYAEILRIKTMIEESHSQSEMMVLIDEIFKGTNSADRIICAKEVLKHLHEPWVMTFVSTHDFELCTLNFEDNTSVNNYHFEEFYEDGKVCFDYRLKKERCTTTNAQALMEMAGIFK